MNATETPETDAAQFNIQRFNPTPSTAEAQWFDFARSLERRLTAMTRERDEATNALDLMRDEFKRIEALLRADRNDERDELLGICQRAVSGIERTVPVTIELEQVKAERDKARAMVKVAVDCLTVIRDRDSSHKVQPQSVITDCPTCSAHYALAALDQIGKEANE